MIQNRKTPTNFPMEYNTERLILKILTPDYIQEVFDFQMRNKELFEQYEPILPINYYTKEHQQVLLKCELELALKMKTIRYYVFLKSNPSRIIGTVCLHDIQYSAYSYSEIGYKFDKNHHHMGYAREAVAQVLSIAFFHIKLHRVFARVLLDNEPSIKLLRSLNFMEEGVEHECIQIRGRWRDHIRFALLHPAQ